NDALFGFVLVANALIGILQEWRAKRTLDRLAIVSAPKAVVLRDGAPAEVAVGEVVLDDVLVLRPGDQVVVDAEVIEAQGLEVDESLLTGESDPQHKAPGDAVMSGSFVAAGSGHVVATKVGAEAYAVKLAEEARRFTLASSDLRNGIDRIIKYVSWAMLPTAALLLFSQLRAHDGVAEALASTVGGVVAMVPEGLVLLTSVAFAASVVRLGRQQVLVQELPAVETLARVDVICLDKTGTITAGDIAFSDLEVLGDAATSTVAAALAGLAASDPNPNATLSAIGRAPVVARAAADDTWDARLAVPFSSARKWSGSDFAAHGTWLLGAPEVLLGDRADELGDTCRARVEELARLGRRVVLLSRTDERLGGDDLPPGLVPQALVLLADQVRPDAAETLAYFVAQDVRVKVISGDNPATVAAVAREAGVPDVGEGVDGRDLPEDPTALADVVDAHHVFGRVQPHQKRAMVKALQAKGHVVAMTGDGVNDVLALKDADIGIAMGSGSSASRAAAQLVLLDGRFATMPGVVAEGRRVINNIQRVANLFLTKTTY
ncbi:MAG TPA: HAD-IC family P-type ATPase, partial [Acidimicrobiales bacterium]|nr:HAD-IC family P-type ATPase [Acidimicrobiales bacterium]